jgi:hypothetical protein
LVSHAHVVGLGHLAGRHVLERTPLLVPVVKIVRLLAWLLVRVRCERIGSRSRLEYFGWRLWNCSSAGDSLDFLDLDLLGQVLLVLLAVPLVLFVDIEDQLLHIVASQLVLVVVSRTYAQMQWLVRLFLSGPLFEPGPLPSQTQLHYFLELIVV